MAAQDRVQVAIKRKPGTEDIALPAYMSEHASGMDLRAAVEAPVAIQPGEVRLIPTGIYIAVPPGYEAQVRPRSGLALKHGVFVVNTPGTIDADYRGKVGIILGNIGRDPFTDRARGAHRADGHPASRPRRMAARRFPARDRAQRRRVRTYRNVRMKAEGSRTYCNAPLSFFLHPSSFILHPLLF